MGVRVRWGVGAGVGSRFGVHCTLWDTCWPIVIHNSWSVLLICDRTCVGIDVLGGKEGGPP